jgi:3-hydroxy-9,10-secoandrosta-1,3,5(10)-triene-9,17-dione monooxygenase reductase component
VPSGLDAAHYRTVLGHFVTGVTIITTDDAGHPTGMAANSFTSVSLDPPLVAFCAAHTSSTWATIRHTGAFCVNVLAEDQEDVCRVFAAKGTDKFQGVGWRPGPTGSPVIEDALAWIDCEVDAVHEAGDHVIVVGRVVEMDVAPADGQGPLVFYRGGYGRMAR